MSLRDIIKRTRARQKAGANQTYPQHRGKAAEAKSLPVVAAAPAKVTQTVPKEPCVHRGLTAVRSEECGSCRKTTQLKVFPCAVFGECTIAKRVGAVAGCCKGCTSYEAERKE